MTSAVTLSSPAATPSLFATWIRAARPATLTAALAPVDTLKQLVPIWKRENAPDGTGEWVHQSFQMRNSECGVRNPGSGTGPA